MNTIRAPRPRTRLVAGLSAVLLLGLGACGGNGSAEEDSSAPLRIFASATPHIEILEYIEDELVTEEDQLSLDITELTEGVQGNQVLLDGEADATFHQHVPFLRQWLQDAGEPEDAILPVATVHVEPLGLYYNQDGAVTSLEQVGEGTSIAITSDVVNQNRALLLLADNGLVELPDGFDPETDVITVKDVLADDELNVLGLDLLEVDYNLTARTVSDGETDLGVVNGNVALQSGLDPDEDTLALERAQDNPYANVLTVLQENADNPRIVTLAQYLESSEVAAWISSEYGSGVLPVNE